MSTNSSPLLESSVSLPDRTLFFGRAELYDTHIHISGWRWTSRYERRIDLRNLDRVETWSRASEVNMVLHVENEAAQSLRLEKGVMLWHWKLKEFGVDVRGRG